MLIMGNISFWRTFSDKSSSSLATSRPLGEQSEPCLAAIRPTAGDEVARGHMKSDQGLF